MYEKKPLYQPWNEEEFQSDFRVRGMSSTQRWMYKSLLQSAFFHETRPYLPRDDEVLWILSGAGSIEEWLRNKEPVLKCFTATPDNPELIQNKRVCKDWNRLTEYRTKMAEMGKQSASAKRTFGGRSRQVVQKKVNDTNINDMEEKGEENLSPLQTYSDKII